MSKNAVSVSATAVLAHDSAYAEAPSDEKKPLPRPKRRILSPREVCAVLGVSLASWNRNFRRQLPVVQLSSRRIGVWNTDLEAFLARQTAIAADPKVT